MTTAQEYLDNKYPTKEQKNTITEINISGWEESSWTARPNWNKLTGELDLSDFTDLKTLNCSFNELTSLNLTNCSKLTELKCWDNKLTEINFTKLPNLQIFYAWTNNLTELDWLQLSHKNLIHLSISNNNLQEQDIVVFSNFTNLEELMIGNDVGERLESKIYNRFYGSLKSLHKLTNLKKLQIEETDIDDSSLKNYLPKDLQIISWIKEAIIKQLGLDKNGKEAKRLRQTDQFSEVFNEAVTNYAEKKLGHNLTSRQKEQVKNLGSIVSSTKSWWRKIGNFKKLENLKNELKEFGEMLSEIKDGMIGKTIPLERLYVIRGNIKSFASKWGERNGDEIQKLEIRLGKLKKLNIQKESEELEKKIKDLEEELTKEKNNWKRNWEEFFNKLILKKNVDELTEISKLRSPDELWKYRWIIYGTQFIGRGSAVAGTILTFQGYSNEGAGILGIYPFSELVVSKLEENLKKKETKWKEFLTDADTFLDNYNELLGILAQFEVDESGTGNINKNLKDLNKKIKELLKIYDEDGNEEIDINELINERSKIVEDLNKSKKIQEELAERSKIWEIIDSIKQLEKAVINYRKFSYYEETLEKEGSRNSQSSENLLNQQTREKSKDSLVNEELLHAAIEMPK